MEPSLNFRLLIYRVLKDVAPLYSEAWCYHVSQQNTIIFIAYLRML
jgi:hypothetical protein